MQITPVDLEFVLNRPETLQAVQNAAHAYS